MISLSVYFYFQIIAILIVSKVIRIEFNMENLPNEIWCNVFLRLDEKSVRSATLACKNWFGLIRSDPNISGHICLKDHSLKEFLTKIEKSEWIWERWPALKTLELDKAVAVIELESNMSKAASPSMTRKRRYVHTWC